jgi:hypothetical protein
MVTQSISLATEKDGNWGKRKTVRKSRNNRGLLKTPARRSRKLGINGKAFVRAL